MKILFLTRLFLPHIGGVEKHVLEISKILVKKGYEVTIITEKYANGLKTKEEIDGIHVYRISTGKEDWFKKFRLWKSLLSLRKLIKNADVVHCHDVFFWYLPFRFIYIHKLVYTTFHGYETVYPPSQKAIFVRKISEKLSQGNICVGDYIQKWYRTRANFVTYGGVNKIKKEDSKNKIEKLKIAFIGRLDEDTGLLFYKQALKILENKKVSFSFFIFGDGPLKREVEKIGKVYGFIKDVDKAIEKVNLIFASTYLSILESLVQQKLVVSTFSNPLKEDYLKMAPFAKFIIIEKDPQKLAEKVEYYLKHPKEEKKLIDKGYNWVKDQTWEKLTDTYLRLWGR